MKDNDLITCREVELVLLEKGQRSRRYKLGDAWELNFDEIREALSEYQPKIVRCKDCKHATLTSDGKMCKYCAMDTDDFGDQRDVYHDADWFCADAERKDDDV